MNSLNAAPRVRMFAGPNGSGKSTIKSVTGRELLGVYVNPDEIEAEIKRFEFLDFGFSLTRFAARSRQIYQSRLYFR